MLHLYPPCHCALHWCSYHSWVAAANCTSSIPQHCHLSDLRCHCAQARHLCLHSPQPLQPNRPQSAVAHPPPTQPPAPLRPHHQQLHRQHHQHQRRHPWPRPPHGNTSHKERRHPLKPLAGRTTPGQHVEARASSSYGMLHVHVQGGGGSGMQQARPHAACCCCATPRQLLASMPPCCCPALPQGPHAQVGACASVGGAASHGGYYQVTGGRAQQRSTWPSRGQGNLLAVR